MGKECDLDFFTTLSSAKRQYLFKTEVVKDMQKLIATEKKYRGNSQWVNMEGNWDAETKVVTVSSFFLHPSFYLFFYTSFFFKKVKIGHILTKWCPLSALLYLTAGVPQLNTSVLVVFLLWSLEDKSLIRIVEFLWWKIIFETTIYVSKQIYSILLFSRIHLLLCLNSQWTLADKMNIGWQSKHF